MNNISNLFENLMTYNDVNNSKQSKFKKIVNENDTTLLNLTVELPTDTEEVTPEDVKVNVGVMNVFQDERVATEQNSTEENEDEMNIDESNDVTPENEEDEEETEQDNNKEESLKLRKEAIRQKRLEAIKALRESKKECDKKCTGEKDCTCESCKTKTESSTDVETAKANIRKRVLNKNECNTYTEGIFGKKKNNKSADEEKTELIKARDLKKGQYVKKGNKKVRIKDIKAIGDGLGRDYLKDYEITYDDGTTERKPQDNKIYVYTESRKTKTESLMHLDTKSLNKLFTEFVKENYKNIDKVVITKAMLENRMLKLEGVITNIKGESTKISLTNRGFNPIKLENKRFIMDFKDTSETFGVVRESLKQPFVFTCTLKEGVLTFEELKYSYKTMIESKVAEVSGKCTLTEGLFDGASKDFVMKEFNSLDYLGKAVMSDDKLGFKIETNDVEKLKSGLKHHNYKESSTGDFYKITNKQKMIVTFKVSGSLTGDKTTHNVEFSARKKDVKNIKE